MVNELKVEEYRSLRQELLQLAGSISRWQLVGFVTGSVAVAVFLGLWKLGVVQGVWVMIPAMLLNAGCIFGIIHDLRSILRIAAYIQGTVESPDGAIWETKQAEIAEAPIDNPLRPYMTPILSLLWFGLIGSLVPVIAAFPLIFGRPISGIDVGSGVWVSESQYLEWSWCWPFFAAFALMVVWLFFWSAIRRSYVAFASGEFKEDTMAAFRGELEEEESEDEETE